MSILLFVAFGCRYYAYPRKLSHIVAFVGLFLSPRNFNIRSQVVGTTLNIPVFVACDSDSEIRDCLHVISSLLTHSFHCVFVCAFLLNGCQYRLNAVLHEFLHKFSVCNESNKRL